MVAPILLHADNVKYFLLRNTSAYVIYLEERNSSKSPGASAGWSSRIDPKHFSIIRIQQRTLTFTCLRAAPSNQYSPVKCSSYIDVHWLRGHGNNAKKSTGSYWVKENQVVT